jgi:hypothetical protein
MVAIWQGPVISSDSEQSNGAEEDGEVVGALGTVGSLQGGKRDEERRRWLLCTNALRTAQREERNRGPGRAARGTHSRLARAAEGARLAHVVASDGQDARTVRTRV